MISGDRAAVVQITASQLGIERFYSELSPIEKVEIVKKEQIESKKTVGMVGDGIFCDITD